MHFLHKAVRYNWMQFSPDAEDYCLKVLAEEGAADLTEIPSRYMRLILCGKRLFKKPGAVLTALLITAFSIICAVAEDILQYSLHAQFWALAGRFLCCLVFLFQFDLLDGTDKRKTLMLLYLVFAFFAGNSFCIHLILLIIFNCMFFRE